MNIYELEPKNVFRFFSEISQIPHGSGNTEQIAEYFINFAKERNLKAYKDDCGNIMIFAKGTAGYENSDSVILQGHMDMVCETAPDCAKDMSKEGLTLLTDGNRVWADGTTLGGDDGIAAAYALAILDDSAIPRPPLEVLLTRDEEIGMVGAKGLDASHLRGKRLINIDSEDEGIITVSCAGGVDAKCKIPIDYALSNTSDTAFKITISGLCGGHSGVDINKGRQNAIVLLGRLLDFIRSAVKINIADIRGGGKRNVIANTAAAVICTDNPVKLTELLSDFTDVIKNELKITEPDITIESTENRLPSEYADDESTKKMIFTLFHTINGVQEMNPSEATMVQTSLNLGTVSISDNMMILEYLIRGNAAAGKQTVTDKLTSFIHYLGGTTALDADYPPWEYKTESPLRNIMTQSFKSIYGYEPQIESMHAGVECGIFTEKLGDIDMVSIGPNLRNIHTYSEYMDVASVKRTWYYILEVLKNLK